MSLTPEFAAPALSTKEIYDRQREMADNARPTVFKLSAQLVDQGRTDTPLCATESMTARLKVYASGGENSLHAHPHEDHMFIVLQGSAQFFDENGELAGLGANEGIMVPKGSLYRFYATSDEPLVLLRVGSPNQGPEVNPKRIDSKGEPMVGDSKANKTVPVRFRDGEYFG
jgi:mannose-6-phosphate isomerase-like protein (cupin superfamily)